MKRLLILSLLMIQGVWAASAAGDHETLAQKPFIVTTSDRAEIQYQYPGWSNTLNNLLEALADSDEPISVSVTANAFNLVQDLCLQLEQNNGLFTNLKPDVSAALSEVLQDSKKIYELLRAANLLNPKGGLDPQDGFETFIKALYVAWLNADTTRAIVVSQNAVQACHQMGIEKVPELWAQLIIDVSDVLDANGIESLDRRSNSISWLVHTNQMPVVINGSLNLSNRNLAVCDAWNIPNLGTVTHLFLNNNRLTALPAGVFNGLGALTTLWLHDNQLTTLAPGTFEGLGALTTLLLHNNRLKTLAAGTFVGLGALRDLHLNNNRLITLAPRTFVGLGALRELYLNNNELTTFLPRTFVGLDSLTKLHLYNNQLTTLTLRNFVGLGALRELHLHSNQLTTLARRAFVGLGALRELHLYNNRLTTLAPGTFAGLGSLTTLWLHSNRLTTLAPGTFAGLDALRELRLNDNLELQLKNSNNLQAIRDQHLEWFKAPLMGKLYKLHHKYRTLVIDSTEKNSAHIDQTAKANGSAAVVQQDLDGQDDDAVCEVCNQVGGACICSTDPGG